MYNQIKKSNKIKQKLVPKETGRKDMKFANRVFCGDCLEIAKEIPSESIDLIYLDPPFFTNRVFEVVPENGRTRRFDDKWSSGIWGYLEWIRPRLKEFQRLLKKTGSLYLHCDIHACHYLKVELDLLFGLNNFKNEIIWKRHNVHNNGKQGARQLGRVHDTILHYSKSDNIIWHTIYEAYSNKYLQERYRYIDDNSGRRFALGDLTAPGGRSKGNPCYVFKGYKRYWRYSYEKIKRLEKEGRIYHNHKNVLPRLKRYLDEMKGVPIQDIWDDIKPLNPGSLEIIGYPTQKPVALLKRILMQSTNPGQVIFDPFCGCGTSIVAAAELKRKFIGVDRSLTACRLVERRLRSAGLKKFKKTVLNLKPCETRMCIL